MQRPELILASFLLLLPSLGCDGDTGGGTDDGQACTAAGCGNGGAITVETPDGALLPDATIRIDIEFDGEAWMITCNPDEDECTRDGPSETPLRVILWRGTTGVTVEFSSDERSDMPAGYVLRVEVEGQQVLDEAGTFKYETLAPNGPDCGPICDNAEVLSFELPA